MKIGLSNFQSIERASLDFTGFAVLTGESNLGKSAVIRAVSAMINGYPGDSFVRRGCSVSAVGVKFDDNLTVKWQKVPTVKKVPGKETYLDINGVNHTKLGRDQFSLLEPYGFLAIESSAGTIKPQIAGQFDKAFLLDITETAVAEVFKVLGRGDIVSTARDSARKDLMKDRSDLKVREVDLTSLREGVKSKEWVIDLQSSVRGITKFFVALKPIIELQSSLAQFEEIDSVPGELDLSNLEREARLYEGLTSLQDITIPEPVTIDESGLKLLLAMETYMLEQKQIISQLVNLNEIIENCSLTAGGMEKDLGMCPTCGGKFSDHTSLQH